MGAEISNNDAGQQRHPEFPQHLTDDEINTAKGKRQEDSAIDKRAHKACHHD